MTSGSRSAVFVALLLAPLPARAATPEQPPRERLRLALPSTVAGRLTVTLESDEGFYLEPDFRFESARALPWAERAEVTLAEVSRTADAPSRPATTSRRSSRRPARSTAPVPRSASVSTIRRS
jgi:hypothetical protein